jgi:hypothetical protein
MTERLNGSVELDRENLNRKDKEGKDEHQRKLGGRIKQENKNKSKMADLSQQLMEESFV